MGSDAPKIASFYIITNASRGTNINTIAIENVSISQTHIYNIPQHPLSKIELDWIHKVHLLSDLRGDQMWLKEVMDYETLNWIQILLL